MRQWQSEVKLFPLPATICANGSLSLDVDIIDVRFGNPLAIEKDVIRPVTGRKVFLSNWSALKIYVLGALTAGILADALSASIVGICRASAIDRLDAVVAVISVLMKSVVHHIARHVITIFVG